MFHVVKYKNLFYGTIKLSSAYSTIVVRSNEYKRRAVMNKAACFSFDGNRSATDKIECGRKVYCNAGEHFFISPKCRIARDLFRNSGYKIIRDKSAADKVIIRSLPTDYKKMVIDIAAISTSGDLYLYNVYSDSVNNDYDSSDFQRIQDYFTSHGIPQRILNVAPAKNILVEFLPPNDEYEEILTGSANYPYMFEHTVPLKCPVEINVETLNIWRHCDDYDVLAKAICNSDWQKYPATLITFIDIERPTVVYYGGRNMELVLEQLGYDRFDSAEEMLRDKVISPEDWNMLQDFIMDRIGLSETGNYMSSDIEYKYDHYMNFIRKRFVVAPMKINEPILFKNLVTMMQ